MVVYIYAVVYRMVQKGTWAPHILKFTVSLPREWIQEIKRMMTVYSTHGLFLTCTQRFCLYLHNIQIFNIHTIYKQLYQTPYKKKQERTLTYLEGQLLACGDKFPSTLVSFLETTAPPFSFRLFHPFPTPQPTSHYLQWRHQKSQYSSSGTFIVMVIFSSPQRWYLILHTR